VKNWYKKSQELQTDEKYEFIGFQKGRSYVIPLFNIIGEKQGTTLVLPKNKVNAERIENYNDYLSALSTLPVNMPVLFND